MRILKILLCSCICLALINTSNAQGILKKMKEKVKEAEKAVSGDNSSNQTNQPPPPPNGGGNNPSNNSGQGLISTPPDVNENLKSAETAYTNKNYGDARYSVQQAMLGVELLIGRQILKDLPASINGLNKDTTTDQVTSTGWGWAGLTIQRTYKDNNNDEFKLTIANNAAWMQAVNMYLNNAGYAQTNGNQQNWKQIRIKGYKGIIEFDKSSGYKISIPIGQTSLVIMEGINFKTEQDMMNAANQIDLDNIKKTLGEQ